MKKVKCINNYKMGGLTIGKIYNVLEEGDSIADSFYRIKNDNGNVLTLRRSRFEEIPETPYNDFLMDFVREKDNLIYLALSHRKVYGLHYMNKADYDELKALNEEDSKKICKKMYLIIKSNFLCDGNICPWCILHEGCCCDCDYGARHGFCKKTNPINLYSDLKQALGCALTKVEGMKELLDKFVIDYELKFGSVILTKQEILDQLEDGKVYVVEMINNFTKKEQQRIISPLLKADPEKMVIYLDNRNGVEYGVLDDITSDGLHNTDPMFTKIGIVRIVANVTNCFYDYGIDQVKDGFPC